MKKVFNKIAFLFAVVTCSVVSGQTIGTAPKIDFAIPKIEPPSPTVAALMRFEEVPVSTYTGVPDISIPIYSLGSHSKDIAIDLSLKYHPSAIAVDEVASVTGLGWSLFAGGTISRTVRGYPDEWYNEQSLANGSSKVGIYRNDLVALERNNYYQLMPLFGANMTTTQIENMDTFLWEAHEKGKFDSEHDLYQFNFMGHMGRFIIEKTNTDQYSVVRLDNDNTITVTYSPGNTPFFTVFDDQGYEYIFDVRETTTQWTDNRTTDLVGSLNYSLSSGNVNYFSSFHLSKIYRNNLLLVDFIYNSDTEIMNENTKSYNSTSNSDFQPYASLISANVQCPGEVSKVDPAEIIAVSNRNVKTKKIKIINVTDKCRIYFAYENGRVDTNLGQNPFKLKKIQIKDWNDVSFKEFEMYYTNSIVGTSTRMLLQKVTEREPGNTISQSYGLTYAPPYGANLSTDYWGYYTVTNLSSREPHPLACKTDILQKMSLPTGGAVVFGFESNSYSYIGADEVIDFTENLDNWIYDQEYRTFQVSSGVTSAYQNLKFSIQEQYINWSATFTETNAVIELSKKVNSLYVPVTTTGNQFILQAGVQYAMRIKSLTIGTNVIATVNIDYKQLNPDQKKILYGGGLRIKSIGHFENASVSAQYYDELALGQPQPLRQKNYNYNFFKNPLRSSGSLAFGKPIFKYVKYAKADIQCGGYLSPVSYSYNTTTTFNNLLPSRTHGSDVGYQEVTVTETGNGSSRYTYRSPIEFPEDADTYISPYPFRPSKNRDYLRGQIKMEEHSNTNGQVLKRITYDYTTTSDEVLTGLSIFGPNCAYSYKHERYASYHNNYVNNLFPKNNCGLALSYVGYLKLYEAFGWTRISSKVTDEFFGENLEQIRTIENYDFNPFNKKLETHTVTNSSNESFKTEYFYLSGDIQEVNSYKGSALLNRNYIEYSKSWAANNFKLPATILTAKGGMGLETRLKYNQYDEVGNALEVQQADGTKISYIWSYNNSYPVAKIQNMAYSAIPVALITAIKGAYSATNSNEASMLTALNSLRTSPALAGAMVTTMTYKPLFGVSTMIDTKGDVITYHYDLLGRLKFVKDKENNILSENQYHYRTQN